MPKRGTIVLIPFPFTDLSGAKIRPAIVISKNTTSDDLVVLFISSKKSKRLEKFDVKIVAEKENGLKMDSIIKCAKIATLDKKVMIGELGTAPVTVLKEINKKLTLLLGL